MGVAYYTGSGQEIQANGEDTSHGDDLHLQASLVTERATPGDRPWCLPALWS